MRLCPTCQARYTPDANVCPIDGTRLQDAPDPLIGRTIGGRYLVHELIGVGGMGSVYRGRHQLVGRDVALKFLAPRYARNAQARERFLREARAANRIDHEHIIDITDFGETSDNLVFLVMEYLDGRPLSALIEEGPVDVARALRIVHQVAIALARAHELDVIHRDIKPDNIVLLKRRGKDFVKLLDFGLAKVTGEHRLTATGKVFGTPEYLSPEQAKGVALTGAVDQYALGVVLYEMLTGVLPFEGPGPEVVLRHMREHPAPPSTQKPGLSREVDTLVLRMLAKDPALRFADAHHLAEELRELLEALDAGGRPHRPIPSRSGPQPIVPGAPATQPWVDAAEESWAQRRDMYRRIAAELKPPREQAQIIERGLAEMDPLVERARTLREQLGRAVLAAKEQEDTMRSTRMRLGRAVDELGRDESRVGRRITELEAQVQANEQRLAEAERPFRQTLDQLRGLEGESVTRTHAELARRLGGCANLWLEVEEKLGQRRTRLEAARREQEDLRFQTAQLKGRMGVISAEGEAELTSLREQADSLGSELARIIEALAQAAGPVTDALQQLPGGRERLAQMGSELSRASAAARH